MQNKEKDLSFGHFLKMFAKYFPYIILLFFLFSFTFQSDLSFNQDLGMHLKLGQIIWQTHSVPKINLFSYTNTNFPFINHHWLFEVLVYLGSVTMGIEALLVIKIIILLVSLFIVLLLANRNKSVLLIPIAFLFLHLIRDRVDLRPEVFSYLFTSLTVYILDRFDRFYSKLIYLLPLISLMWVNTHIFFPVGIFLQTVFLGDLLFQKFIQGKSEKALVKKINVLSIVFILSILSTLVNPNFIKGALYPFTVFNNYGVTIVENQSIFVRATFDTKNHDYLFFYLSLWLVITSLCINLFKEKFSLKKLGLSLLGLALACQSIKGMPYLVFITMPIIVQSFDFIKKNVWMRILIGIFVVLLCIEAIFYLTGNYYSLTYKPNIASLTAIQDEKPAIDFVLKHNLPQPLFNNFGTGSYLIYRDYPTYKVFVDERPEAYPASFFQKTYLPMLENYSLFKKEDKKIGFKTVIFGITDQNQGSINFLNAITKDSHWKIVFFDQYMIVLVKSVVQQQLHLPIVDLGTLHTNNYKYTHVIPYTNISNFLFNLHYLNEARLFNQKALEISPYSPPANLIMEQILVNENINANEISQYDTKAQNGVFW